MIWIDDRELRSDILKVFDDCGIAYAVKHLPVGDLWVDDIPIERKSGKDYLDFPRLNNQLLSLSHNAPLSYLVIIGTMTEILMGGAVSRNAYLSSLIGSSFKRAATGCQGIVVTINVESLYDLAIMTKFLEQKSAKGEPRLPQFKAFKWSQKDQIQHILVSIPGIGLTRAKDLLVEFKSIKSVANATRSKLEQVEGIGPKLSRDIYEAFNLEV